jgi:hypothetical protein
MHSFWKIACSTLLISTTGACVATTSSDPAPTADVTVALQVGTNTPVVASVKVPVQYAQNFADGYRASYERVESTMAPLAPNLVDAKVTIWQGANVLTEGPLKLSANVGNDVLATTLAASVTKFANEITNESSSSLDLGEAKSAVSSQTCWSNYQTCTTYCINCGGYCLLQYCLCMNNGDTNVCIWFA